jgi:hypothetical protein
MLIEKPLTIEKLAQKGYYFRGLDIIQFLDTNRFYVMPPAPISKHAYLPLKESFPPHGWGDYKTTAEIFIDLNRQLLGEWVLMESDPFGSRPSMEDKLVVTPDSVFAETDSAGTKITYRGAIDFENYFSLSDSSGLPDFFLKDRSRVQGRPKAEAWHFSGIGTNGFFVSFDSICLCGPRGWPKQSTVEMYQFQRLPQVSR